MKRTIIRSAILIMLVAPHIVFASIGWKPLVPSSCDRPGGCQSICDIALLIQNTMNDGIILATFLAAVLFAWAGMRMVTAGGDTHQISSAKKTFGAVFIGFVIVLSAWLIVDTIMKTLMPGGSGNFGPWNEIC